MLILCSEPVGNLKIDRLLTVKEMLNEAPPIFSAHPEAENEAKTRVDNQEEREIENQEIHTPHESAFLLNNNISGSSEKRGYVFTSVKNELPEEQSDESITSIGAPRPLYADLLDSQNWPEAIDNLVARIRESSFLSELERRSLLKRAKRRREALLQLIS